MHSSNPQQETLSTKKFSGKNSSTRPFTLEDMLCARTSGMKKFLRVPQNLVRTNLHFCPKLSLPVNSTRAFRKITKSLSPPWWRPSYWWRPLWWRPYWCWPVTCLLPKTTGSMIVNIAGCVNRNLLQCPLLVLFPLQQYLSPKSNRLVGPEPGLLYCYTVILVIQSLVW